MDEHRSRVDLFHRVAVITLQMLARGYKLRA